MIEFEVIVDASQFREQLARLKTDLQQEGVNKATRAAGLAFKRAVINRAPVLKEATKQRVPGTLKRAVYLTRSKRSTSGAIRYFIGIRSGKKAAKSNRDAFYWRFLEGGWIPRGPGKGLRGGERSRRLQRERALEGGAQKVEHPFIKKAFEAAKAEAFEKFKSAMNKYLAKVK